MMLCGVQAAMAVMNRGLRPEIPRGTPPPLASLMQVCLTRLHRCIVGYDLKDARLMSVQSTSA